MRIALITGASSGFGAEFARQLDVRHLDEIWLIARREDRLIELSARLKTKCRIIVCDLLDPTAIETTIGAALEAEQPIVEYCVNNAGFGKAGPFETIAPLYQLDMVNLNCRALVDVAHRCLPLMKRGSVMLNISSTASLAPLGGFAVYGATKAFVSSFSVALMAEVEEQGVHSIAVCPGPTETEFSQVCHEGSTGTDSVFKHKAKVDKVVEKALLDAAKLKSHSYFGLKNNVLAVVARFLPAAKLAEISFKKVMK